MSDSSDADREKARGVLRGMLNDPVHHGPLDYVLAGLAAGREAERERAARLAREGAERFRRMAANAPHPEAALPHQCCAVAQSTLADMIEKGTP